MILNYKDLEDLIFLKCDKFLAEYFLYTCKLPLFSIDKENYVFLLSDEIKKGIENMSDEYKSILYSNSNWNEIKNLS